MKNIPEQGILDEIFSLALPAADVRYEIARRLRAAIEIGLIKPGCRLKQQDIANSCHVSRMPVREALRMLDVQGYIENNINRGYVVVYNLPNLNTATDFKKMVGPLKKIYMLCDSAEARTEFEINLLRQIRSLE